MCLSSSFSPATMSDISSTAETPILSTGTSSCHGQTLFSLNFNTQITQKLGKNGSYSSWRAQVTNLFFGYDLLGHLDGSSCPSKTVAKEGTSDSSENPAYKLWLGQDRLLLQGLQSSCKGAASSLISHCSTAAKAWSKLEITYANQVDVYNDWSS